MLGMRETMREGRRGPRPARRSRPAAGQTLTVTSRWSGHPRSSEDRGPRSRVWCLRVGLLGWNHPAPDELEGQDHEHRHDDADRDHRDQQRSPALSSSARATIPPARPAQRRPDLRRLFPETPRAASRACTRRRSSSVRRHPGCRRRRCPARAPSGAASPGRGAISTTARRRRATPATAGAEQSMPDHSQPPRLRRYRARGGPPPAFSRPPGR